MKEFKSMREFERFLAKSLSKEKVYIKATLEAMAKYVEEYAKGKFGLYQEAAGPFPEWAELSPYTMEDRVKRGFEPDNPLYRTGETMYSIYHKVNVATKTAVVGSDEKNMLWQELGTPDAKHPIPARPVLGPAAFQSKEKLQKIAAAGLVSWIINKPINKI